MKKYTEDNEGALEDFTSAAKLGKPFSIYFRPFNIHILGSKFAQAEATKLNPYAALCNAMLKRMMGDLNGQCDSTKNG